ncbi:MAG: tetratricopeptide (TPR) repeat protein, partial [Candidatus Azotimanducaceae bacterium]
RLLDNLLGKRGNSAYEVAQVWNTKAFAYYILEDTPNTIKAYENVLKQPQMQISKALEMAAVRALFQLYYSGERYQKAIDYMNRWEALNNKPDTNVAFIKASAYYELEQFEKSLAQVKVVEEYTVILEKVMKENWLYLYVVLYNELKDYDNVIKVLERMVVEFPKKQYWMHLAGMYAEKEWEDKALSAYYAAYMQNMFAKETEVVMLSQRLLNASVPIEAAAVLEKGMKSELVEENEKNIRILATAYTMAQEHGKAIDAWRRASKYAEDGEVYYRLAQALANEDRHKEAAVAYNDALTAGELNDAEDVQFWLGISLMQTRDWSDAENAFKAAAKDKDRAKSSRQYIRYINSERKRLAALKEMVEG